MQLFRRLTVLLDELQKLPQVLSALTTAIQYASGPENRAEQERQYRVLRCSAWASWAAVIAAIVYALITLFQWREMAKQTDASLTGQAGWLEVLVEDIQFVDPDLIAGIRIANTKIWISNRGLTPLTRIAGEIVVRTFVTNRIPVFTYDGPKTCYENGIIYPDRSKSDSPQLAAANNPPMPLPLSADRYQPGEAEIKDCRETNTVTILPAKPISPPEFQLLLDGEAIIVAYGKMHYMDIFKREHWTYMCRVLPLSKTIAPNVDAIMLTPAVIDLRRACLK